MYMSFIYEKKKKYTKLKKKKKKKKKRFIADKSKSSQSF